MKVDFEDDTGTEKRDAGTDKVYTPIDDLTRYDISLIGGQVVERGGGCGTIKSGRSVYFGAVSVI